MTDYLLIGHLTRDAAPEGARVGGTAYYAARAAQILGLRVAVVTAFGADLPPLDAALPPAPSSVAIHARMCIQTTAFTNTYAADGARRQWVTARAATIMPDDVPASLVNAPAVHLAPVLGECAPGLLAPFGGAGVRAATLQGWLRRVGSAGAVHPCLPENFAEHLVGLDAAVFSEEDVAGLDGATEAVIRQVPTVAITCGERGALLYQRGDCVPVRPAHVYHPIDPTGAGDVFAAVFIAHLSRACSPIEAAVRASALAGAFVGHGFAGLAAAWRECGGWTQRSPSRSVSAPSLPRE